MGNYLYLIGELMNRIALALTLFLATSFTLTAQETAPVAAPEVRIPSAVFAPNLIGPIFGIYGGDINIKMSEKVSIDTELGYFNIKLIPLIGAQIDEQTNFWFGNLKVGPTIYLGDTFHGLFLGAYAKAAYFFVGSNGDNFNATSLGAGAKLGWRWTLDWFSMALGGGYEYNKAFAEVNSSDTTVNAQLSSVDGGFPYVLFKMEIAVY